MRQHPLLRLVKRKPRVHLLVDGHQFLATYAGKERPVTASNRLLVVDLETKQEKSFDLLGDGSDPDDKGVYKAIAGAQKYALMKTFLVETGDDPERDDAGPPPKPAIDKSQLITTLEAKARQGTEAFRAEWRILSQEQRDAVRDHTGVFQQLASQADQSLSQEDIPQ